jgi:hypothetical protein
LSLTSEALTRDRRIERATPARHTRGRVAGVSRLGILERETRQGEALLGYDHELLRLAHAHHRGAQTFFRLRVAVVTRVGALREFHAGLLAGSGPSNAGG